MHELDHLLANAEEYSVSFDRSKLALSPKLRLVILSCMDSRVDIFGLFGLREGDAHVIRNAGGAATDDVVRSIAVSQRAMGTDKIFVVHHTDCGAQGLDVEAFVQRLHEEVGSRPSWDGAGFEDRGANVERTVAYLRRSPFLKPNTLIRGFLYDVATGVLEPHEP